MNMQLVEQVTAKQMRTDLPQFAVGDTIKVFVRIIEGGKERLQAFEGVVLAKKGAGVSKTFIIRKMSGQIGVERTFFFHSPILARIEVVQRGYVRRAKLYYLRNLRGKSNKVKRAKL